MSLRAGVTVTRGTRATVARIETVRPMFTEAQRGRIRANQRATKAREEEETMANSGLNKVMLIGNLGMDPELKHTQSGRSILRMRLATTDKFKDNAGQWQERTEWHTVIVWGNRAEALSVFLRKGHKLYIEGKLKTRQWEAQDGSKRSATEVVLSEILVLGSKGDGGGQGEQRSGGYGGGSQKKSEPSQQGGFPESEFGDDDIPFAPEMGT